MIENPHGHSNRPNICGFTGVAVRASKLMFWSSKTWSSCWEVGNIVFSFESNGCEVDDDNLISELLSLSTEDVVHFDISVGDVVIMEVFDCLTNFKENNSGDVP